jgi:hypothetical protein
VVGVDLAFKRRPLHQALRASMTALPFSSRRWPLVVSCDTLEHVPVELRQRAVEELARVADRTLLLAFPSGPAAANCYRRLAQEISSPMPGWLAEHLAFGLPDAEQVAGWLRRAGWAVTIAWSESAASHHRLMRWETRRPVQLVTYGLTRLAGPWLAKYWPVTERGELLRALLVARRKS